VSALLQVTDADVEGATNEKRVLVQFRGISQIEQKRILAGVKFLMQFVYGDPRDPQFPQETPALEVLISDIGCEEDGGHAECAFAQAVQGGDNFFDLIAEKKPMKIKVPQYRSELMPSNKRNRERLRPELPASGGNKVLIPRMNFPKINPAMPYFPKASCVRRTQESGFNEMRQSRFSARRPLKIPI
jgi:hypothetical protein